MKICHFSSYSFANNSVYNRCANGYESVRFTFENNPRVNGDRCLFVTDVRHKLCLNLIKVKVIITNLNAIAVKSLDIRMNKP